MGEHPATDASGYCTPTIPQYIASQFPVLDFSILPLDLLSGE